VKTSPFRAGRPARWPALLLTCWAAFAMLAGEFNLTIPAPTLDRWMYPFNFEPGTRPVASTFASFDPRFDTRDAQFLLGWDTPAAIPAGADPRAYLLRRARVTLTITARDAFIYDPTHDSFVTYLTNQPGYVPDSDPGRPMELHGAGFRGGFTAATFLETSSYGVVNDFQSDNISIATRNAFAAMFDATGALVDIANHVGQANAGWTNPPFEAPPWAVGQTTNAAPGEAVPQDSKVTFDLNLADPLTVGYLQAALADGRLRLVVSSLSPAQQVTPGGTGGGGTGAYPQFATRENVLFDPPRLELEGTLVGPEDAEGDGLPDDWERFHFGHTDATATQDSDGDGASNAAELAAGTDPDDAASVLRILSAAFDADGQARLRFTIAPSRVYRVELSRDFQLWGSAQGTLTYPETGVAEFREERLNLPPAVPTTGFYRVVVE